MILVTGGSGYFGSLLVQKLVARGDKVRVFDLNRADDLPHGVEFQQGDIRDADAITRACQSVSVVHHNVAQVPLAKDRALFESVNHHGTRNALEAALNSGAKRFVYTSSSAVFGVPKENPVTEATAPAPREAYGRAKLAGEQMCALYASKGLPVSVIRPRTILGHGRLGIFQILFEWIRTGFNVPVLGAGDNVYQFVHADDLAEACIRAGKLQNSAAIEFFNVGAERFGTMRETLEALCAHARTGSKVKSVPMGLAVAGMKLTSLLGLSPLGDYHSLMYGRSMYFDITKTKSQLGVHPRFSNTDMFIESYEWYLKHRTEVKSSTQHVSHHRAGVKQGVLSMVKWAI